jgi:hypothetical protein
LQPRSGSAMLAAFRQAAPVEVRMRLLQISSAGAVPDPISVGD